METIGLTFKSAGNNAPCALRGRAATTAVTDQYIFQPQIMTLLLLTCRQLPR